MNKLFQVFKSFLRRTAHPWKRWPVAEIIRAKTLLESKDNSIYTSEDWMLVVDLLIQLYLPNGVINSQAEYLIFRTRMLRKIEESKTRFRAFEINSEKSVTLLSTVSAPVSTRVLSPVERTTLEVAEALAAKTIEGVSDNERSVMKSLIIQHLQAQVLGQNEGTAAALGRRLFDSFGYLNFDFQSIANTELGEIQLQGFIAAQPFGSIVERREAYQGACKFCELISGRVFIVVDPDAQKKDGWTEVWFGKTNVGRSPPPTTDAGEILIGGENTWWPASGLQHSCCRGRWLAISEKSSEVSQEFENWLQDLFRKTFQ